MLQKDNLAEKLNAVRIFPDVINDQTVTWIVARSGFLKVYQSVLCQTHTYLMIVKINQISEFAEKDRSGATISRVYAGSTTRPG